MTAVAGTPFTAPQWNVYVRDNLNHCAPAVATAGARWIVTTGWNSLAERSPLVEIFHTADTTANTSYEDLDRVGPDLTVTSGPRLIVTLGAAISNSTAGWGGRISVGTSGATAFEPSDRNSFFAESGNANDGFKGTWTTIYEAGVTAGETTWTCKYRAVGGATATFDDRLLAIIPF